MTANIIPFFEQPDDPDRARIEKPGIIRWRGSGIAAQVKSFLWCAHRGDTLKENWQGGG
jgi:hypothetical protein